MFINIRPRLFSEIPWGWKNKDTDQGPVVVESLGEIRMPKLKFHFDWKHFEAYFPEPEWCIFGQPNRMGTRDMKSVFFTGVRFLGWEKMWLKLHYGDLNLKPITDEYLAWNEKLLKVTNGALSYFMIGDDYGFNDGLLMEPGSWREFIKPEVQKLIDLGIFYNCQIVFHSDGDIYELMDDFATMRVDILNYQPVGRMERFKNEAYYKKIRLWPNFHPGDYHTGYSPKIDSTDKDLEDKDLSKV